MTRIESRLFAQAAQAAAAATQAAPATAHVDDGAGQAAIGLTLARRIGQGRPDLARRRDRRRTEGRGGTRDRGQTGDVLIIASYTFSAHLFDNAHLPAGHDLDR